MVVVLSMISKSTVRKKPIKCPNCKRRLFDASSDKSQHILVNHKEDNIDLYIKCPRCTKEIGVTIKVK